MPSEVATIPIRAALKSLLVSQVSVTSVIAEKPAGAGGGPAIYDEGSVHQSATYPYLTIGAAVQVPDHTMGPTYGWNCTIQIKAVRQGAGQTDEDAVQLILSRVVGVCYKNRPLTVTGYRSAWCDEWDIQPTLIEILAGVTTRYAPGILRVKVQD